MPAVGGAGADLRRLCPGAVYSGGRVPGQCRRSSPCAGTCATSGAARGTAPAWSACARSGSRAGVVVNARAPLEIAGAHLPGRLRAAAPAFCCGLIEWRDRRLGRDDGAPGRPAVAAQRRLRKAERADPAGWLDRPRSRLGARRSGTCGDDHWPRTTRVLPWTLAAFIALDLVGPVQLARAERLPPDRPHARPDRAPGGRHLLGAGAASARGTVVPRLRPDLDPHRARRLPRSSRCSAWSSTRAT